jgi:hypothetical protein
MRHLFHALHKHHHRVVLGCCSTLSVCHLMNLSRQV